MAAAAGVRRRFAPHQLRHAHAVEMARGGVPLVVIQRQLGHSNLGIASVYLQGIDNAEIIDTVPHSSCADDPGKHITSALTDRGRSSRGAQLEAGALRRMETSSRRAGWSPLVTG